MKKWFLEAAKQFFATKKWFLIDKNYVVDTKTRFFSMEKWFLTTIKQFFGRTKHRLETEPEEQGK